MIFLFINSDPPRILYRLEDDPEYFLNQYLSYPWLKNIEAIRNDVRIEGGAENATVKVNMINDKFQINNLVGEDPPLFEEAIIYKDNFEQVFKGFITRFGVPLQGSSLIIKA